MWLEMLEAYWSDSWWAKNKRTGELERMTVCALAASGATNIPFQSQMSPDYVNLRVHQSETLSSSDHQRQSVISCTVSSGKPELREERMARDNRGWALLQSGEDRKTKQRIGETEDAHLEGERGYRVDGLSFSLDQQLIFSLTAAERSDSDWHWHIQS